MDIHQNLPINLTHLSVLLTHTTLVATDQKVTRQVDLPSPMTIQQLLSLERNTGILLVNLDSRFPLINHHMTQILEDILLINRSTAHQCIVSHQLLRALLR